MPTMAPSLLMRSMSVILTALADRTRNMTDILQLSVLLLELQEVVEEVDVAEEEVEVVEGIMYTLCTSKFSA